MFPRDFKAEPDFDAVFLRHRRLVMTALILCGLMAFELLPWLTAEGRAGRVAALTDPARAWIPLLFLIPAVAVMVVKDKRILLALMVLMILPYGWNFATSLPR